MEETAVKEERSSPEPSPFMNNGVPVASDKGSIFSAATEKKETTDKKLTLGALLEQLCGGKPRAQQVKILEDMTKNGRLFFTSVKGVLEKFLEDVPSCAVRISEIGMFP